MKIVMCVGIWPENNYEDFEVFAVKPNESDEEAIERAKQVYSEDHEFYIQESE